MPARRIIVFLHGYGANGHDLQSVAGQWQTVLPDSCFLCPDAPETIDADNPHMRQWFPLETFTLTAIRNGIGRARDTFVTWLNGAINQAVAGNRLAADADLFLMGFSQGAMLALDTALTLPLPRLRGVMAFSGLLARPGEMLAAEADAPRFFLTHGEQDDVVPFAASEIAHQTLSARGFVSCFHPVATLGHAIAPDQLQAAIAFIRESAH